MSTVTIVADGATRFFAFPFAIFSADELEVRVGGVIVTEGFAIVGQGASNGGHIEFVYPPLAGVAVTLRRLGKVEVSDLDRSGFLEDKLVAGDNVTLTKTTQPDGQTLVISAAFNGSDYLRKDQNLADLPDKAAARTNLDVYAKAETDAAIAAAAPDLSPYARNDQNLAGLTDKAAARANLGVYGTADIDQMLAGVLPGLASRLDTLELNLAVTVLRDQIDTGWSVLKMVDGIADEFEDESGVDTVASTGENYDSAGDFYQPLLVPAHGSDFLTGGSASASVNAEGVDPAHSCDNDTGTLWGPPNFTTDAWWQYDLGVGNGKVARKMRLYSNEIFIKDFVLKASNDGSNWVDLLTGTFPGVLGWSEWTFANATSYRYYRLHGTSSWNTSVAFMEIELMEVSGVASVENMSLVSLSTTAEAQPSEARLLLLHQAIDPVTVGADFKAHVSRDNGATWTEVTLADEGAFDASTRILAGIADVSGQPAGTAMRWKVSTHNNKSQRLHGVWMQWR